MDAPDPKFAVRRGSRFRVTPGGLIYDPLPRGCAGHKYPCRDCRECGWCPETKCRRCYSDSKGRYGRSTSK